MVVAVLVEDLGLDTEGRAAWGAGASRGIGAAVAVRSTGVAVGYGRDRGVK